MPLPRSPRAAAWPPALLTLAGMCSVLLFGGCFGSERSAEAVCRVFEEDGVALHDHYDQTAKTINTGDDGQFLGGMADLIGAPGRLQDLMQKFADVAPEEIEPAFQHLADSFEKVAENQGKDVFNPLTALTNGLSLSFNSQGAWDEANAYLREHCGDQA